VGSINKRKNVLAQARAFLRARHETKSDAIFAIAGRAGFGGGEISALINKEGAEAVKLLGYVQETDLPALYTGARALLFVTLYEGFGIPAVEAFSCGCPVIGASVGSVPEIVADAGLLADPKSEDSIAAQIQRIMRDEALRADLVQRGFQRARDFSWEKAATECLRIYAELLGQ
jgi:alpha-1,3-rhamnosyl/mannosyltransferase